MYKDFGKNGNLTVLLLVKSAIFLIEKLLLNDCLRLHMFAKRFHIPKIYTFIFLLKMVYEYLLQSCGLVDVNI